MTPTHVPLTVWADEGQRVAPALADVAAAIVTGRSGEVAAAVALGIARACSGERRVAVADLVGGISSLSPLDDQPGLLECLRDGTPVSDIGQPLLDAPNVYILPSGRGTIAERWVFESARWDRLVAGFREVDALLLLVAPPGAPGLAVLVERVDGVVAVDLPPAVLRAWPLIATVDEPEQELPTLTSMPREQVAVPVAPVRRRVGRWIVAGAPGRHLNGLPATATVPQSAAAILRGGTSRQRPSQLRVGRRHPQHSRRARTPAAAGGRNRGEHWPARQPR